MSTAMMVAQSNSNYDLSFKILLIGDSGVGKSSLMVSFISSSLEDISPTIVYDVTRRETFTNLSDIWAKEVELYSTNQDCVKMLVGNKVDRESDRADCVKMLVGNKVDRESDRAVTREEGVALAKELGALFLECSAKTRENVEQCFEELSLKILEVPSLLEEGSTAGKRNILQQHQETTTPLIGGCCL
ncbi:small GTPase [Lithospermum erythrorhizon]|uniref:Small GTPase n=1 Tax=Lithospermum erythrorhizon TaxID=34254 RepID=A0AAV3NPV7_LITER